MNRKRAVDRLQNLALVLLTLSALVILLRFPLLDNGWDRRVQSLLTSRPSIAPQQQEADLTGLLASVHLTATSESEYGRYSQLFLPAESESFWALAPLFQEALGSVSTSAMAADKTFQDALGTPSLYLDLTVELPLSVVASWLGGERNMEQEILQRNVRALALTTEEDNAMLYLYSQDGTIFRCETALPSSAVREKAAEFSPNGGNFAFESNYSPLSPYTILTSFAPAAVMDISAALPAGYSAYNLLSALDFNAHTNSRYTESGGAEVVVDSPGTLRISPDGVVSFTADGAPASPLYTVSSAQELPTALEALEASLRLAHALTDGTTASALSLRAIDPAESGWIVSFQYQAAGLPVVFPDRGDALTVTITGRSISAFSYRCRAYAPSEETSSLLPPDMAVAIASLHPGAELSLGYVDSGGELLPVRWLAG